MPPSRKLPSTNPTPRMRTQAENNVQHELFAHEYMVDFDAGAAYRRAGYNVSSDEVAKSAGRRLLRSVYVQLLIEKIKLKRIEEIGSDAKKTILRLQNVYLAAMEAGDYASAVSALDKLGKHYGIYEVHQKQKYTQDDAERLRKRLEEAGFNFKRVNDPSSN